MYSILLVEDEKYIREGLKVSLDWEEIGLNIIGEATDGDEGYNKALELKPDIILADIRMPGMDGLEMSKRILEKRPEVKIIILSGYDDYKYIRQSLQLGLCDYLMKPINDDELLEVMQKTIDKIKSEELKKKHELEKEHQVSKSTELLKLDRLNKLLRGIGSGDENGFFSDNNKFIVAVLKVENYNSLLRERYEQDSEGMTRELESLIREMASSFKMLEIFQNVDRKREIVILKASGENGDGQSLKELNLLSLALMKNIKKVNKFRVNIGAGDIQKGLKGIKESYREAVKVISMLSYADSFQMVSYNKCKTEYSEEIFSNYTEMYRKLIYESASDGVNDLLNIIYSRLKDAVDYPKSEMFRNMSRFIELAYENSGLEELELETAMDSFDTFEDLWAWFVNTVNESFKGSGDISNTPELLRRVKEYIDQNYHTDRISLGYLSKRFYINQFRLCKLFKSEYQENFQNYVIGKRIAKAKELLLDSNMKVYEVSELVGYEDVKYFARIFKKYTGCSPNEFRERRKNH